MNSLKTTGDPIPLSTFPDFTPASQLTPLVTLASHRNLLRGHKTSLGISLYEYSVLAEAIAAAVDAEPKNLCNSYGKLYQYMWSTFHAGCELTGYNNLRILDSAPTMIAASMILSAILFSQHIEPFKSLSCNSL